jgi:hypothetical protein
MSADMAYDATRPRVSASRRGRVLNFAALFQSALVALLRNKMRCILTVLGVTIGDRGNDCVWPSAKRDRPRMCAAMIYVRFISESG